MNTMAQSNFGEGIDFILQAAVQHWGHSGQGLKEGLNRKPWRNTTDWLALLPVDDTMCVVP